LYKNIVYIELSQYSTAFNNSEFSVNSCYSEILEEEIKTTSTKIQDFLLLNITSFNNISYITEKENKHKNNRKRKSQSKKLLAPKQNGHNLC